MNAYYVPGTLLTICHVLFPLILSSTVGSHFYYLHFTDGKLRNVRGVPCQGYTAVSGRETAQAPQPYLYLCATEKQQRTE
jgi:hypothetical protein